MDLSSLWITLIPIFTGLIGTITGIAGLIMGYKAYRKTNTLKLLDLRLELRKEIDCVYFLYDKLLDTFCEAKKSRPAVASAIGLYNSGWMKSWNEKVELDERDIENIKELLPNRDHVPTKKTLEEIEEKLVNVHRLQKRISCLTERYQAELDKDDEERKELREDNRRKVFAS